MERYGIEYTIIQFSSTVYTCYISRPDTLPCWGSVRCLFCLLRRRLEFFSSLFLLLFFRNQKLTPRTKTCAIGGADAPNNGLIDGVKGRISSVCVGLVPLRYWLLRLSSIARPTNSNATSAIAPLFFLPHNLPNMPQPL